MIRPTNGLHNDPQRQLNIERAIENQQNMWRQVKRNNQTSHSIVRISACI